MQRLNTVAEKLLKIQSSGGTNVKIDMLKVYLNDEMFKKVVTYALDSDKVFHVKALPKYVPMPMNIDPKRIFDFLDRLNNQTGTSKDEKVVLHRMACASPQVYSIIKMIVEKDIKCGVGVKSINKAIPGTINYSPYCRCSTDTAEDKFWKKPGRKFGQLKEDGMFFNMFDGEIVHFTTRNGKPIKLNKLAEKLAEKRVKLSNRVHMGEMLIFHNGKCVDRQTGNGILNSILTSSSKQLALESTICQLKKKLLELRNYMEEHQTT